MPPNLTSNAVLIYELWLNAVEKRRSNCIYPDARKSGTRG
jgi:hypothetical protein